MVVSFTGRGNQSTTKRKSPTCLKS